MKNKYFALLCLSIFLIGCKNDKIILDDFNFSNESVSIVDSLENVNGEKAHVVFLYGQSNADGCSHNEYLEKNKKAKYEEYLLGYDNVYINFVNDLYNNSSKNEFICAKLGCGCVPSCFGPEMGIAEKMHLSYPNEKTFIIKWTKGGTRLKNEWLDNHHGRGDLYNGSMDFTIKCLDYLKGKGYDLSLDGICWMQGESDSIHFDYKIYLENTRAYVSLLRHDLKKYQNDIKFIDAGINEESGIWPHPKQINKAKKIFSEESTLNYYIDSSELGLTSKSEPTDNVDKAHYDSLSMVKLGQAFGDFILK